jgi:hypothetical protein
MKKPKTPFIILILGDLLVILSFVWIGRSNHSLAIGDIAAGFSTALPFVLSWFAIMPWFGIYKVDISTHWKRLLPRLLLAWAVAGPVGLILRTLFLGRAIPAGIIPAFAIITLAYIGLTALVWRLGYIWIYSTKLD